MNMYRKPLWPTNAHSLSEAEARLQRTGQLAPGGSETLGVRAPGELAPAPKPPALAPKPPALAPKPPALAPKPLGSADALPQDLGTPAPLPPYMADPYASNPEPQLAAFHNQVPYLQLRHVYHAEARVLGNPKFKQALERVGFQRISQKLQEILPPVWVNAEWAPVPTAAVVSEVKILTDAAQAQVNNHLAAWVAWEASIPRYIRDQLPPSPGPFKYEEPK